MWNWNSSLTSANTSTIVWSLMTTFQYRKEIKINAKSHLTLTNHNKREQHRFLNLGAMSWENLSYAVRKQQQVFSWCGLYRGCLFKYRRSSLSQSPEDQTKFFEITVVWDSQPVTSFTFSSTYVWNYRSHVHVLTNYANTHQIETNMWK